MTRASSNRLRKRPPGDLLSEAHPKGEGVANGGEKDLVADSKGLSDLLPPEADRGQLVRAP